MYEGPSNLTFGHEDERDSTQNARAHKANSLINENDNQEDLKIVITAENKKLENIYVTKFCRIWNTVLYQKCIQGKSYQNST